MFSLQCEATRLTLLWIVDGIGTEEAPSTIRVEWTRTRSDWGRRSRLHSHRAYPHNVCLNPTGHIVSHGNTRPAAVTAVIECWTKFASSWTVWMAIGNPQQREYGRAQCTVRWQSWQRFQVKVYHFNLLINYFFDCWRNVLWDHSWWHSWEQWR